MKFHPEDPRLTAYVLGELEPDQAAAVESAAAFDSAVRSAIDESKSIGNLLATTLSASPRTLHPRQRQQILQAAGTSGKIIAIADHRRSWKPWAASAAAAALLVFAVAVFSKVPVFTPRTVEKKTDVIGNGQIEEWRIIPMEIALLPAPGPADASQASNKPSAVPAKASASLRKILTARNEAIARSGEKFYAAAAERLKTAATAAPADLPVLTPRGSVTPAVSPELALPVQAGSASFGWIRHAVREDHRLPPGDAVRIEEILNHFPLQPAGSIAVSQGVTLSTELISCPWKPSATILIAAFRGADSAREIEAVFKADPATVRKYRLLGYSPIEGMTDSPMPTHLAANALTLVAIEIEPLNGADHFGSLQWTVNHQPATEIPLTRKADTEPSDDARFASLLCTYAQWLAGDPAGMIDGDIVAALAREMAAKTLPPDRSDLLVLIDQSLNL